MRPALAAELRFGLGFYLGLGAPAQRRRYPECRVRAARGYAPEDVRELVAAYLGRSEVGALERVNHRAGLVTLLGVSERFFIKEFPCHHRAHDVERALRLSRADRAWRAAHLLRSMGIATPRAIGTAQRRGQDGRAVEYLATEWLDGGLPFPEMLAAAGEDRERRATLLREFAEEMRVWHSRAVYTRDLVKNVLVCETEAERTYWLTDLDGVHPIRRVNEKRILFHLRQLAYWSRLTTEEAEVVCTAYLGGSERAPAEVVEALRGADRYGQRPLSSG